MHAPPTLYWFGVLCSSFPYQALTHIIPRITLWNKPCHFTTFYKCANVGSERLSNLTQDHTANEWQHWNLNPGSLMPEQPHSNHSSVLPKSINFPNIPYKGNHKDYRLESRVSTSHSMLREIHAPMPQELCARMLKAPLSVKERPGNSPDVH